MVEPLRLGAQWEVIRLLKMLPLEELNDLISSHENGLLKGVYHLPFSAYATCHYHMCPWPFHAFFHEAPHYSQTEVSAVLLNLQNY
jgi:hypothetical protein